MGRGEVGEDMRLQHQAMGSQAGARLAPRRCLPMSLSPNQTIAGCGRAGERRKLAATASGCTRRVKESIENLEWVT